jgi:hypothetical protein
LDPENQILRQIETYFIDVETLVPPRALQFAAVLSFLALRRVIVPALFFIVALSAQSLPNPDALLHEIHAESQNLTPAERVEVLHQLSIAATAMDPKISAAWAIEMYDLATARLTGAQKWGQMNRAAQRKNALTVLSFSDTDAAAARFFELEPSPGHLPAVRSESGSFQAPVLSVMVPKWQTRTSLDTTDGGIHSAVRRVSIRRDGTSDTAGGAAERSRRTSTLRGRPASFANRECNSPHSRRLFQILAGRLAGGIHQAAKRSRCSGHFGHP